MAVLRSETLTSLEALREGGVDVDALPESAREILTELSVEEAWILATVNRRLESAAGAPGHGRAPGNVIF